MTKEQLLHLFIAYRDKTISAEDLHTLRTFVNQEASQSWVEQIMDEMADGESVKELSSLKSDQMFDRIMQQSQSGKPVLQPNASVKKYIYSVVAVAALLIAVFLFDQYEGESVKHSLNTAAIVPGSSKGSLLLDNGTVINLDELSLDTVIQLDGYSLIKDADGQLSYQLAESQNSKKQIYNSIVTPKGGEYKLCLPDGTKIWINAESKLRYPLNYGDMNREVQLEGEALFEVAKVNNGNRKIPFTVITGNQRVEVLGTVFNVNSYSPVTRTTLVEGAVRLHFAEHSSVELKPNQQLVYNTRSEEVDVRSVDPLYAIAWRNGVFAFDNADLYAVMDAVSRWYDVTIDYKGSFSDVHFSGTISRHADINKLLNLISLTGGVHFEIKERRVSVMR